MIVKFFWGLRALFSKPFFGKFEMPSYLGKPTFLMGTKRIFIHKKVRIFPQVRLETHRGGSITIFEDTVIAQNVHITSAENLEIGKGCLILANTFITNIDHDYQDLNKPVLSQVWNIKKTKIGDFCKIGMGTAILPGTILGKQCIVGANSVVRGEFPDYCVIAGAPAKIIKKYNPETQIWERI